MFNDLLNDTGICSEIYNLKSKITEMRRNLQWPHKEQQELDKLFTAINEYILDLKETIYNNTLSKTDKICFLPKVNLKRDFVRTRLDNKIVRKIENADRLVVDLNKIKTNLSSSRYYAFDRWKKHFRAVFENIDESYINKLYHVDNLILDLSENKIMSAEDYKTLQAKINSSDDNITKVAYESISEYSIEDSWLLIYNLLFNRMGLTTRASAHFNKAQSKAYSERLGNPVYNMSISNLKSHLYAIKNESTLEQLLIIINCELDGKLSMFMLDDTTEDPTIKKSWNI